MGEGMGVNEMKIHTCSVASSKCKKKTSFQNYYIKYMTAEIRYASQEQHCFTTIANITVLESIH